MARRTRKKEMSGIFDFFSKKKKPEQKSLLDVFSKPTLPALPSPGGGIIPAPKPEKRSVADVFRPKPKLPARTEPSQRGVSLPEVFSPKLPAVPEAAPRQKETVPWKELIPAPAQEEAKPVSEVARTVFKPEAPPPTKYVFIRPSAPPEISPRRPYGMIVSPERRLDWKLPTPEELAQHFRKTNNLDAMWDYIRQVRAHPEFKKDQLIASWRGAPIEVPLDPVVYREKYTDFANFYGIPWAVIENYLNVPPEQERQAEEALWIDVLSPLNIMIPETFEMLKPDDIPGFFNVSFIEPSGQYYLFYVEPLIGIGGQGAA